MPKHFPIILLLVLSVFAASVMCCCLTEVAHAETVEQLPPCHQKTDASSEHQQPSECDCKTVLSLQAKKMFDIDTRPNAIIQTLDVNTVLTSYLQTGNDFLPISNASFQSGFSNSPPLFIKNSNLRL